MATTNQFLASMARLSLSASSRPSASSAISIPRFLLPLAGHASSQSRFASGSQRAGGQKKKEEKKKKTHKSFRSYDLSDQEQFSLCDAIRYARAFEVGHPPNVVKYDLAVKLRTLKNGPMVRNRIKLPHPVKSDIRVGVVCPENSTIAIEARQLGAIAVGEESLFASIREGKIPFNRLICHSESEAALKKANLGKILGPKGMMPSQKMKTITGNIRNTMREMIGADEYRERAGVVRMAVGQLGFTPQMLADNIKAMMKQVKNDISALEDEIDKKVEEVVLHSTNGPGFSLNASFNPTDDKITPEHLQGPM
ncbi:ribosomal protein L1 [Coniochaeta ligniaria NRRL 30616]|uniref:Ribosomal protein L1 n=1 Tax=Coniochaeta ligniaria NRRL 30616 TaxID=1408157 RepID=A0A1J7IRS1_9PEZI|nr:ribosomal protein L1 [Coniochaeta ligniaria NRRL 30616]